MSVQLCPMGCGRRVLRAITWKLDEPKRAGEPPKWMLLDPGKAAADDTYANIAVYVTGTGTIMARVLRDGEVPTATEWRQVTHFATCPNKDKKRDRPTEPAGAGPARAPLPSNVVPFRRPQPRVRLR